MTAYEFLQQRSEEEYLQLHSSRLHPLDEREYSQLCNAAYKLGISLDEFGRLSNEAKQYGYPSVEEYIRACDTARQCGCQNVAGLRQLWKEAFRHRLSLSRYLQLRAEAESLGIPFEDYLARQT
jgi:hypothetical protein